ncbi:sensitivity to high expression protein she9 [Sporothrix curviconia]|uniref:Sensitive to high expression protein 9, mitochondrial n=1 Tax=Sporothrix curviconia TaxID=1260050 RepID=A0ABP0AW59_9PEZI
MATWSRVRSAQSSAPVVAAAPVTVSAVSRNMACPSCDISRRRRYSSSPPSKPPKDDNEPTIIFAPPPPPSSLPSEPPLPFEEPPTTSTNKDEPPSQPQSEAVATAERPTTDSPDTATDPASSSSARKTQDASDDSASFSSLPSFVESRRSALQARFSRFMDDLQARFVSASQTLSDLTGYTAIEHIKAHNARLETDLATAQAELRVARRTYQAVNERRAATQREVTTLLARKDSWAPPDLERFTVLYRQDHELETSAQRAVEELKEAEADEQRLSAALTSGILKRYHEEQVWSDRIRRQSTWGTWGLMGINVVLFIILQVIAEPWRRRRLMRGIAEAESGVLEDVRKELADVRAALATVVTTGAASVEAAEETAGERIADTVLPSESAAPVVDAEIPVELASAKQPPATAAPVLGSLSSPPLRLQLFTLSWPTSWRDVIAFGPDPVRWRAWFDDISSERTVNVRMRDVSIVALQSAAAGAAIVGGLVFAFR